MLLDTRRTRVAPSSSCSECKARSGCLGRHSTTTHARRLHSSLVIDQRQSRWVCVGVVCGYTYRSIDFARSPVQLSEDLSERFIDIFLAFKDYPHKPLDGHTPTLKRGVSWRQHMSFLARRRAMPRTSWRLWWSHSLLTKSRHRLL